ncbi:MAG: hypothetical protein V2A58_03840, partial [Planctomycetota bacterium]
MRRLPILSILSLFFSFSISLAFSQETSVELRRDVLFVDGKPFFPIVVWNQPKWLIKTHKDLGANVIVAGERLTRRSQILALLSDAQAQGVYVALPIDAFAEEYDSHPALLFWLFPDEPDLPRKPSAPSFSVDAGPD